MQLNIFGLLNEDQFITEWRWQHWSIFRSFYQWHQSQASLKLIDCLRIFQRQKNETAQDTQESWSFSFASSETRRSSLLGFFFLTIWHD